MYRVDKREFQINEIILPPENSYQESNDFNESKKKIEKILSEECPDNKKSLNRKSCLYIFAELSDAIRFYCKMSGSKIYQVSLTEDNVNIHRGDMNWTEIMHKLCECDQTSRIIAKLYWAEQKTFKPCWEILVNQVKVIKIIVNNNNLRKDICRDYHGKGNNVEKMDFYIKSLLDIPL